MSEETGNVTITKEGAIATLAYVSDSGMGLENVDKQDLALPFLKLLQSGSDETKKKHAKYVEGAEAGMFYNTVTKKLYNGEKGIEVIPVFYKMTYPEWAPFEKREGRPIHIKGNKDFGFTKGNTTPPVIASVLGLYDSSRIQKPTIKGKQSKWSTIDASLKVAIENSKTVTLLSGSIISPSTSKAIEDLIIN